MPEARQKQPWDRVKGEGETPYAAFCRYLNLGTQRSIHQAVKDHLAATAQPYRSSVYSWWRQWAAKYTWRHRAQAYDEYREYVARKAEIEAEAQARATAADDRVQQRHLLVQEAISLRTMARVLAGRILQVLSDPQELKQIGLKRQKSVEITRNGTSETRFEEVYPGVLDLVKLVGDSAEVGGRLYRLAQLDQPDPDGSPKTAERKAEEVAKIITGRLLGLGVEELLTLRDELSGPNGQPEEAA